MVSNYDNDIRRRKALREASELMNLINSISQPSGSLGRWCYQIRVRSTIRRLTKVMFPTYYRRSFEQSDLSPLGDATMDRKFGTALLADLTYSYLFSHHDSGIEHPRIIEDLFNYCYYVRSIRKNLDRLEVAHGDGFGYAEFIPRLKYDKLARIRILFLIWSLLNVPDDEGRYLLPFREVEALSLTALAYLRVTAGLRTTTSKGFYLDQQVIDDLPIIHRLEEIFQKMEDLQRFYLLTNVDRSFIFSQMIFHNNLLVRPVDKIRRMRDTFYSSDSHEYKRVTDFINRWSPQMEAALLRRITDFL